MTQARITRARQALAVIAEASPAGAWLVGGAVRDALLGLVPLDLDVAVAADPSRVARAVAEALDAPRFSLSDRFGGYRVSAQDGLQIDLMPVEAGGISADLRRRDTTVNALAVAAHDAAAQFPAFAEAAIIDELGGLRDLRSGVQRACSAEAMADDPLRVVRLARAVAGRDWQLDGETVRLARAAAPQLHTVAGERIGAELLGTIDGDRPLAGLTALRRTGALAAVLPEFVALDGLEQSAYHDLDVGQHTQEVLRWTVALETELGRYVPSEVAEAAARLMPQELGGGWTGRAAQRFGALLHDIAKPQTRQINPETGRIGFPNHDREGAAMVEQIMERLRAPRRATRLVQGLTLHHLRLGFLVHARPLDRGTIYDYLARCSPVEIEVSILSWADRLATRGRKAEPAIAAHAEVLREMLPAAIAWREAGGAPAPLHDGTALQQLAGAPPGPWVAAALERQRRARYLDPQLTAETALEIALPDRAEQ